MSASPVQAGSDDIDDGVIIEPNVCPIMTAGNVVTVAERPVQYQLACIEARCGIWSKARKCCGLIS